MDKIKFQLNRKGVADLMKSSNMQDILSAHATGIRDRCGNGYKQDLKVGKNRANAMVWADTYQAKADNKRNNTILKAVK